MIDLRNFFGDGNEVGERVITDPESEAAKRLRVFIDAHEKGAQIVPLPRTLTNVSGEREIWWYVFWSQDGLERLVADSLRAFIGPTYSDMGYQPSGLDPTDGFDARLDAAVRGERGTRVLKFQVSKEQGREVSARLATYLALTNRHQHRRATRMRPVGKVLRDFDFSLARDDAQQAEKCLNELHSDGHLDAQNLTYLEIRFRAQFQRYAGVLNHPGIADAIRIGAPRAVVEGILVALYEEYIRDLAEADDADAVVRVAAAQITDRYQPLFATAGSLRDPRAIVTFLAVSAALGRQHPEVSAMTSELPATFKARGAAIQLADRLVRQSKPDSRLDALEVARGAFDEADIDGALRALRDAPATMESTKLALQCALEAGDRSGALFAASQFEKLSKEDRGTFEASKHWLRRLQSVQEMLGAVVPLPADAPVESTREQNVIAAVDGWQAWFARLANSTEWHSAVTVLQDNAHLWDFADLRKDGVIDKILTILGDLPSWGEAVLQRAMPELVNFFVVTDEEGEKVRAFSPLIDKFYEYLFLDDQPSVPSCTAMGEILVGRVNGGLSPSDYDDRLELFGEVLEKCGASGTVGIGLDAVESLLIAPCPSVEARMQFIHRIAALAKQCWKVLRREEQDYCRSLMQDALPDLRFADSEDGNVDGGDWSILHGRFIAIYSLQERALNRACGILQRLIPEARVESFSNSVGGDSSLRSAARSADLFVIVTRAAKHAATEYIEAERSGDIERPGGIGARSIVSAVAQWRDRMAAES